MSVQDLKKWTQEHLSGKHLLIFNNISIEAYIFYAGLLSNRLFQGAKHFMYTFCIILKKRDVFSGLRNIEYLRTYLKLFRRIFMNIVRKIQVGLNINVADNVHAIRLEHNLTNMINMTMVSKYKGDDDYQKIKTMHTAIETEYRCSKPVFPENSIWEVKENYLVLPIVRLNEFSNLLLSPKVNIYS